MSQWNQLGCHKRMIVYMAWPYLLKLGWRIYFYMIRVGCSRAIKNHVLPMRKGGSRGSGGG